MARAEATTVLAVDLGAESGRVMAVEAARRAASAGGAPPLPEPSGRGPRDAALGHPVVVGGGAAGHRDRAGATTRLAGRRHLGGGLRAARRLGGAARATRCTTGTGAPTARSERMVADLGRERIFEETGIQFMPINTLTQLFVMRERRSPLLEAARTFLTIPDLLHYWLTGERVCEFTNATTTQLYNPRSGSLVAASARRLGARPGPVPRGALSGHARGPLPRHPRRRSGHARHRQRGGRHAGGERGRGVHLQWDVEPGGHGGGSARDQPSRARRQRDERGRGGRWLPPAEERDGPVDPPGVPSRLGAGRASR